MASETAVIAAEEEIDYEGLGNNVPLHINMIAGALAGISEHALMFPVDVIRVSWLSRPWLRAPSLIHTLLLCTDTNADPVGRSCCDIYRRHSGAHSHQ